MGYIGPNPRRQTIYTNRDINQYIDVTVILPPAPPTDHQVNRGMGGRDLHVNVCCVLAPFRWGLEPV